MLVTSTIAGASPARGHAVKFSAEAAFRGARQLSYSVGVIVPAVWAFAAVLAPWQPAKVPPPTPWAKAGARGWAACEELGRDAIALRGGVAPRGDPGTDDASAWTERADRCPHVPDVLVLAAQLELVSAGDLGFLTGPSPELGTVFADHEKRIRKALRMLRKALAECARRREAPPRETRFLVAYALVSLGQARAARIALARAIAADEVELWRAHRMGAVIAMLDGDLDTAMALSYRASIDASVDDRLITRFIRVLVLDRAGAIAAARAELLELRTDAGHTVARRATESLLPVHERLYLRALDAQVADDPSGALMLWDAYLSRPEPAAPERKLAERHRSELVRRPAPVR